MVLFVQDTLGYIDKIALLSTSSLTSYRKLIDDLRIKRIRLSCLVKIMGRPDCYGRPTLHKISDGFRNAVFNHKIVIPFTNSGRRNSPVSYPLLRSSRIKINRFKLVDKSQWKIRPKRPLSSLGYPRNGIPGDIKIVLHHEIIRSKRPQQYNGVFASQSRIRYKLKQNAITSLNVAISFNQFVRRDKYVSNARFFNLSYFPKCVDIVRGVTFNRFEVF